MDCPSCTKTFEAVGSLCQHYTAKHGGFLCSRCFKAFTTEKGALMHSEVKHGERGSSNGYAATTTDLHGHEDPYPGIQGYWMRREAYNKGRKSFGWYLCNSCCKTWFSAHAHKFYRQGCQCCETESYPCCMWVNTGYGDRSNRIERDEDKPHDSARCEACRKGDCRFA